VNPPPRPLRAETVTLICTIGESFRVLRIADRPGWGSPSWSIQRKVDGAWRGEAMFRVSASLRDYLKARVDIDADAAAILARLPARSDRDPAYASPPRYQKRLPAVVPTVKATPTKRPAPTGKRAAVAAKFLTWRDGKPAHALAGSQAIPAPPAAMAQWAPRAAPGNVDAEAV
jgi:hypothetical protein